MQRFPRLVISAVRGGLGKTTLSLGIIAAWRNQGKKVASFKKGPDFIDAGWLGAAAGRPCYNLDLFLMEEESIRGSFVRHSAGMGAAVIEGNRGLFDGVDGSGTYSTARLARLLDAPVVLVVDCTKSSSTVAAVILGCRQFDPLVGLQGIILNNVSPGRHESVIRQAIEQSSGIQVVGAVPRMKRGEFPERHMGLTPLHEHPDVEKAIAASAAVAEKYLDLAALWQIAGDAGPIVFGVADEKPAGASAGVERAVIGVIRDKAFQFYYPDNLEALEQEGAELREINALNDQELPSIDALYIGGGFPETQAAGLAVNVSFTASVKAAVEKGLPVYAECGGLIYLGRSLKLGESVYPMTSVLPADFVLEKKPQAHGYTQLEASGENPFFEMKCSLRGHEFHYSRIVNIEELTGMAFTMQRGAGIDGSHDGLVYKNVLATYTHLHALGAPHWAGALVRRAREFRAGRSQEAS
jgi:cobyrinic acid a,c-diamide synthase